MKKKKKIVPRVPVFPRLRGRQGKSKEDHLHLACSAKKVS